MMKTIYKIACVAVILCVATCEARKGSLSVWGDHLAHYEPDIWNYVNDSGTDVRNILEEIHSERLQVQHLVGLAVGIAVAKKDLATLHNLIFVRRPAGWHLHLGPAVAYAAEVGYLDAIRELVDAITLFPDPRLPGILTVINWNDGEALKLAVKNNHRDVVNYLLDAGARAGANIALVDAAERGFTNIVQRLLLVPGINVNWDHGKALRMAAENGHADIVTLLRNAGASRVSPLRWAIRNGRWEAVASMIELGAPLDDAMVIAAGHGGHIDIIRLLAQKGGNLHVQNDRILQDAVEQGDYHMVYTIIELVDNEESNLQPFDKDLILRLIAHARVLRSNPPAGKAALFYGRIIQALTQYIERMQTLVQAAASGLEEETQLLLRGKNIHWNHEEALREAIKNRHDSVVQLLLQAGADSERALVWAARHGDISLVTKLVMLGAKNYDDALIAATTNGHPEVVELLVEKHNPNLHAGEDSAIRAAVEQGDDYIVTLLIGLAEDHPENIPPFDRVLLNDLIARALILRSAPPAGRTEQNFTDIIATLRDYVHRIYEQEVSEHPTKRRRGGLSTI